MTSKKLKVVSPMWANYTGSLGRIAFVDGVSVEALSRQTRDRLSASMQFVEVDEDGEETPAGVAHRLVSESHMRADVVDALTLQSEDDKKKEAIQDVLSQTATTDIFSKEDLEKIADKKGIKGLRDVAERWGVKHRSIPVLIQMILDSQERWVIARDRRLAEKVAAEVAARGVEIGEQIEEPTEVASIPAAKLGDNFENEDDDEGLMDDPVDPLLEAAATGDLGAALSDDSQKGE